MAMRFSRIPISFLLASAAALSLAACGSDDEGSETRAASDSTATQSATADTRHAPTTTARAGTPSGGTSATDSVCDANQSPNGLECTASGIRADDPDGGLVAHADAGTATAVTGVLPAGTEVTTVTDPARCAVTDDGAVWWEVSSGGTRGWVNSRLLSQSAGQEPAARDEMCEFYEEVLGFEAGPDFASEALTSSLRAALNGPPPGIVDALDRISGPRDSADLAEAYDSLQSYVGPLCVG